MYVALHANMSILTVGVYIYCRCVCVYVCVCVHTYLQHKNCGDRIWCLLVADSSASFVFIPA